MARQLERRFVNDYAREHLVDKHWQPRVWLGPVMPGGESNEFMVTGRWADVIVFEPTQVTIIEAKLEPKGDAIGQLKLYAQMFKQTPRFQQHWDKNLKLVLLTTRIDDHVQELTQNENIEYVVFRPDWIPYWEKRRFRI